MQSNHSCQLEMLWKVREVDVTIFQRVNLDQRNVLESCYEPQCIIDVDMLDQRREVLNFSIWQMHFVSNIAAY